MAEKFVLTPEQKREWKYVQKVLEVWSDKYTKEDFEGWKSVYFKNEWVDKGHQLDDVFASILLSPDQSKGFYLSVVVRERFGQPADKGSDGSIAINWFWRIDTLYKETGVPVFSGRLEWMLGVLFGPNESRPKWGIYGTGFIPALVIWMQGGGYHELPWHIYLEECLRLTRDFYVTGWRKNPVRIEEELVERMRPFLRFSDPESLPPQESPYYYIAALAQEIITNLDWRVDLRKGTKSLRLENVIIERLELGVQRLADLPRLPLLPKPACLQMPWGERALPIPDSLTKPHKGEVYDEYYEQSSSDFPYPPLRYMVSDAVDDGQALLQAMLDTFKGRGYLKRMPAVKEGKLHKLFESEELGISTVDYPRGCYASFKAHPRLAMSDEMDLQITIGYCPPGAKAAIGSVDADGYPEVTAELAHLVVLVQQGNYEILPQESSVARNLMSVLKSIGERYGFEFIEAPSASAMAKIEF